MTDQVFELLDQLYAEVPTIECKGLCWNSCGPIDMSRAERERIEARGVHIQPFTPERVQRWERREPLHCAALDESHRCTVYDIRPLICRLWGVGRGKLACPHGCERGPGKRLKHAEVIELVLRSMEIGGMHADAEGDPKDMLRFMQDPELRDLMSRYTEGERSLGDRIDKRLAELKGER